MASTLVCTSVLAGCSEAASGDDCNARIRIDGSAFRPHNELNPAAPAGRALGER